MSGISFTQFEADIKPIQQAYNDKYRELAAIRDQFEALANKIELQNKSPDDLGHDEDSQEYADADDARYEEQEAIGESLSDYAYQFDLEWDGSFTEGGNSFWTPSTC